MSVCPNCFTTKYSSQGRCPMCGYINTVMRDKRALPVEKVLNNRYMVGRVLGIGGFGITYVAYDMSTRERIALKEYFPSEWATRISNTSQIAPASQAQQECYQHGRNVFINEARVLSKLRHVSNIVNVRTLFEENGTAYIVMALLEGNTLSGYLKSIGRKSLPYTTVNQMIMPVATALSQIHAYSLLHRDVSPDNIIVTNKGEVYLIDFGATRVYAVNSPKSMSVVLKPGFAPIEQYSRSGNQGPWTDVYALAATYYYLVAGRKPTEATDRIAGVAVVPLKNIVSDIPDYISNAVERALSIGWKDRPQTVGEFMQELRLGNVGRISGDNKNQWGNTIDPYSEITGKRPSVLLQVGQQRQRYFFGSDGTLTIGRNVANQLGNVKMPDFDKQISGIHCRLQYAKKNQKFHVENYSGNRTYTVKGVLIKDDNGSQSQVDLDMGDWFYIQTKTNRYIFYLEVE